MRHFTMLGFIFLFSSFHLWGEEAQTSRFLQFENEQVKVWRTVIMPNQPLKMHRHERDRVIVTLKAGELDVVQHTGEKSKLVFEKGKAYWMTKDPQNKFHADVNQADEPVEVMVIELKNPLEE